MSDDSNVPMIPEQPANDFSQKDLEIIQAYQEKGLEGIGIVDEQKMASMLEMYLSGKTYRQISTVIQIKKEIVLYMSYKFNWFQLRQDYLQDMEQSMRNRVLESKIVDQDFLLQLQAMWRKKIGSKMDKYFATNNEDFLSGIDLKEVDKYMKSVEILHKLAGGKDPTGDNNRPMVGVNAGDGVTITRKGDNEIEITPKSKAMGEALKMFADSRREEERK
jgi:uncharacterized protein YnzC (UPF0291/DUF896 family)